MSAARLTMATGHDGLSMITPACNACHGDVITAWQLGRTRLCLSCLRGPVGAAECEAAGFDHANECDIAEHAIGINANALACRA